ncbi:N-alpha-acetyltransferase 20 [Ciconia boyciana]|uniref:N-alpha-acetyltransferase 20 n=1 Tax=Ciconia boyciana TaxID=52775 RepID=UPI003B9EBF91
MQNVPPACLRKQPRERESQGNAGRRRCCRRCLSGAACAPPRARPGAAVGRCTTSLPRGPPGTAAPPARPRRRRPQPSQPPAAALRARAQAQPRRGGRRRGRGAPLPRLGGGRALGRPSGALPARRCSRQQRHGEASRLHLRRPLLLQQPVSAGRLSLRSPPPSAVLALRRARPVGGSPCPPAPARPAGRARARPVVSVALLPQQPGPAGGERVLPAAAGRRGGGAGPSAGGGGRGGDSSLPNRAPQSGIPSSLQDLAHWPPCFIVAEAPGGEPMGCSESVRTSGSAIPEGSPRVRLCSRTLPVISKCVAVGGALFRRCYGADALAVGRNGQSGRLCG